MSSPIISEEAEIKFSSQIYANVLIKYLQTLDSTPELIDQIVKLSVDYQIMSKYTSYILVDSEVSVKSPELMQEQVVPHYFKQENYRGGQYMLKGAKLSSGSKSNSVLERESVSLISRAGSFFSMRSSPKSDVVNALDGGMDMYGGSKSSKTKIKSFDLYKLVKKQSPDGSFDLTYQDLGYQSINEYASAKIASGLNTAKLFASAIMYGYLKYSSQYKNEFTKLFDWLAKYYSDIDLKVLEKIYLEHKKFFEQSSNTYNHDDSDY